MNPKKAFAKMWNDKNGSAYVWLIAMIALFVTGLAYIIHAKVYNDVYNVTTLELSGDFKTTGDRITGIVTLWPIIVIFGIFLWAIVRSVRKDVGSNEL